MQIVKAEFYPFETFEGAGSSPVKFFKGEAGRFAPLVDV